MTAPLSQDLRERLVHAVEDGSTVRQAARRFAVSASAAIKRNESTPQRIVQGHPRTGLLAGKTNREHLYQAYEPPR